MPYRRLDPEEIIKTLRRLERRISERFPDAGLAKVCTEVRSVADESRQRCESIRRSNVGLRVGVAFTIALILGALVLSAIELTTVADSAEIDAGGAAGRKLDLTTFVQVFEPAANSLVLVGAALIFLVTMESRVKRGRALRALNELRALAHVVDMHQLTKDPERDLRPHQPTTSSPTEHLDAFLLSRYLDYCSEILSLIGKIASLYGQSLNDPVVLTAVNEIEELVTGFARKIWQKVMVVEMLARGASPVVPGSHP